MDYFHSFLLLIDIKTQIPSIEFRHMFYDSFLIADYMSDSR